MRLGIVAVIAVAAGCGGGPHAGQSPAIEQSPHALDGRTVLPVTFADGVTVDLVYPPDLALERLERTSEVILPADTGAGETHRDVRLARVGELAPGGHDLLLSFGDWEALVMAATDHGAPPLSTIELRAFAEDLAVVEAEAGFPVVVLGPRLRIAPNPDDQAAPVLLVLDAGDLNPGLALTRPESCRVAALENEHCHEETSILVSALGDPGFQDAVLGPVDVRVVRPAA
jgi:hypothetical protein